MGLLVALCLLAADEPPVLTEWVNDFAGVVDPGTKAGLTSLLQDLEKTDSTQVVVLTVRSLGGLTIEQFSHATATRNRIGQKHRNNGVLITVAVDDRKCRIEVGYGLEGRLPDAICATIIREEMVPEFKKGRYGEGTRKGTEFVVKVVKGEYAVSGDAIGRPNPLRRFGTWFIILFIVPVGVSLVLLERNRHGPGCILQIVLLVLGTVILPDVWTFDEVGTALVGTVIVGVVANVVAMLVLSIFGLVKLPKGSGGSRGWSWSSGSSSSSSSGSSGSSFSGGGGSFGGGGASGSW